MIQPSISCSVTSLPLLKARSWSSQTSTFGVFFWDLNTRCWSSTFFGSPGTIQLPVFQIVCSWYHIKNIYIYHLFTYQFRYNKSSPESYTFEPHSKVDGSGICGRIYRLGGWYMPRSSIRNHANWYFAPQYVSGWWFEPLWKMLVNWDDYSQYMGK